MNTLLSLALVLILLRWAIILGLEELNQRSIRPKSEGLAPSDLWIQYTVAKSRFAQVSATWQALLLVALLATGLLSLLFAWFVSFAGLSRWALAAFLAFIALASTVFHLPFRWYAQFRLEERFGFNTSTYLLWWLDQLKALLLSFVLSYPLLLGILFIGERAGSAWWLWAWAAVILFQVILLMLAPTVIMPWFNKFTSLPVGPLRERLIVLAKQNGFATDKIQIMDGSRRSKHSNAFLIGFGRFRRIVLFDTLVEQLSVEELASVLAHEIGHYQRKHVVKFFALSVLATGIGFFLLSRLANNPVFFQAFGFPAPTLAVALLLFALLVGPATFWITPLANYWSRRYEYEADAAAAQMMHGITPLLTALRKLSEKNLSNLNPHPLYSGFTYSHPTLAERERALSHWASHQTAS